VEDVTEKPVQERSVLVPVVTAAVALVPVAAAVTLAWLAAVAATIRSAVAGRVLAAPVA
jgi:hypothetical protein